MLNAIKRYNNHFKFENAKGLKKKIISLVMLSLPHILTCLIFILFFPERIIEILIVGLILPDFFYFLNVFIYPTRTIQYKKTIAHITTFIVTIFLLYYGEYMLFLVSGIHLFLDFLDF